MSGSIPCFQPPSCDTHDVCRCLPVSLGWEWDGPVTPVDQAAEYLMGLQKRHRRPSSAPACWSGIRRTICQDQLTLGPERQAITRAVTSASAHHDHQGSPLPPREEPTGASRAGRRPRSRQGFIFQKFTATAEENQNNITGATTETTSRNCFLYQIEP